MDDTTHVSLCGVGREQLPIQDETSPSSCHSPMSTKHCHSNGVITCSKNCNLDHENHNLISSPISTSLSIAMSEDYSCGLFSFYPKWLQSFANKETFLFIFCLTSVLQGMYYTYFVSVLTTIEKLYQIQSKTTGIVMSATEIGQIGGALFLTYYGGQGHRPKWIAAGMIVFAIASILCSTPHFLFGGQSILSHQNPSVSSLSSSHSFLSNASDYSRSLCVNFNSSHPSTFSSSANGGDRSSLSHDRSQSLSSSSAATMGMKCDDPDLLTAQSKVTSWVLTIFFSSLFLIGIGSTAVNTLGIPYIDDNVAPKESPLYFGITIGVRIFGPVFGFLLGSICTSIHVDFLRGEGSGLAPSDPQWIGAWWLGVFIVGFALILAAFPMLAFPKKLPQPDPSSYCHQQQLEQNQNITHISTLPKEHDGQLSLNKTTVTSTTPSLKDFPTAVARLLRNDILLYRTASSVLHILPIAGLYTFLPKYLESQFQLTAAIANMISGIAGILVMGAGIFASGIFMRKFKPSARFVAAWIALAALLYAVGMGILMFLGCPKMNIIGISTQDMECSSGCQCPEGQFSPVCSSFGETFISPCIAGCSSVQSVNSTHKFHDCKCVPPGAIVTNGFCDQKCSVLGWYIFIFAVTVLIHSTSEVGSMILTLRCVEPRDKAMALGLVSFATGLFGNVPCPIVYGAVVDSACLFWENTCGQLGACRVYDADNFRFAFHGVTAFIMIVAFIVDIVVWFKAQRIKIDEEHVVASNEECDTQH